MDGINDVIEMLKQYNENANEEDILYDLETLSRISILEWQSAIEKEARRQQRCPECFEKLESQSYIEWHPFGDTVAGEEFIELSCPTHGIV